MTMFLVADFVIVHHEFESQASCRRRCTRRQTRREQMDRSHTSIPDARKLV